MRAVVHDRYGPPEVLRVADVERPVPKEDEVLVRVHASTVTRSDAMGMRSVEYRFSRVFTGIRRPRRTSFGSEFAGRVEEVGADVSEFRVGDDVFGFKGGANAEYVAVRESGVIAREAGEADLRGGGGTAGRRAARTDLPAAGGSAAWQARPRLRRRRLDRDGRGPAPRPATSRPR